MKLRKPALLMLQSMEDWRSDAFMDNHDGWTIGWGRMEGVKEGDTTTKAKETRWLKTDIERRERFLSTAITVPLTPQQHDALVLFVYNIGTGQFYSSTLRRRLNAAEYSAVPSEMARWIYDDGVVSPGLMIRRAKTIRLWQIGRVWGE